MASPPLKAPNKEINVLNQCVTVCLNITECFSQRMCELPADIVSVLPTQQMLDRSSFQKFCSKLTSLYLVLSWNKHSGNGIRKCHTEWHMEVPEGMAYGCATWNGIWKCHMEWHMDVPNGMAYGSATWNGIWMQSIQMQFQCCHCKP